MKAKIILFVILMVAWNMLAPVHSPLFLFLGALSSYLTVLWAGKAKLITDNFYSVLFKMLKFLPYLVKAMIKSNIDMIKLILSPIPMIQPTSTYVKLDFDAPWKNILWANAVTFTPGTVTYFLDDDGHALIYSINPDFAEGLEDPNEEMKQEIKGL